MVSIKTVNLYFTYLNVIVFFSYPGLRAGVQNPHALVRSPSPLLSEHLSTVNPPSLLACRKGCQASWCMSYLEGVPGNLQALGGGNKGHTLFCIREVKSAADVLKTSKRNREARVDHAWREGCSFSCWLFGTRTLSLHSSCLAHKGNQFFPPLPRLLRCETRGLLPPKDRVAASFEVTPIFLIISKPRGLPGARPLQ